MEVDGPYIRNYLLAMRRILRHEQMRQVGLLLGFCFLHLLEHALLAPADFSTSPLSTWESHSQHAHQYSSRLPTYTC